MPGNLLDTDIYFPSTKGKDQDQINREVLDYLYMLQEQLRYSFGNLGVGNFNSSELTALSVMITEPVYAALQDVDGNVAQLTLEARGLDLRLTDAEGNIDTVTATAETLSARLSTAEGDLTELSATAEGLMGRIASAEGDITTLTATASGLSTTVSSLSTNMSHTLRLGADGMTVYDADGNKVQIAKGCLRLTGAITWDDISKDVEDYIGDAYTNASSAVSTASDASRAANSAKSAIDNWTYGYTFNGSTYIDGRCLYTGTVTASNLRGGTVEIINGGNVTMARMVLGSTQYAGVGLEIDSIYGGMRFQSAGNVYLEAWDGYGYGPGSSDPYIMIGSADVSTNMSFVPSNDSLQTLGSAGHKWSTVYASSGQIQTSDRALKNSIEPIPEKYINMVDTLMPVRYKYDDGTSGRYHTGFVAQDVKAVMDELGIDSTEFGGWVADVDENSNPIYMLRYEEFIGILWDRVRKLTEKIKMLEGTI